MIAIIAILIGLLLPAVQKVREAAARTKCMNNMKQLGTACHNYHDARGTLPPAIQLNAGVDRNHADSGSPNFGPNWLVLLLPYFEQGALYSTVSSNIQNYPQTGDNGWRAIGTTQIKTLLCPSDTGANIPYAGAGGGWARGNYACNAAGIHGGSSTSGVGWQSTEGGISPTNTSGQAGLPTSTSAGGVMCINWGATLTQLTNQDGTANTIMLAEVRIGSSLSTMDPRGTWAIGFPGASVVSAQYTVDCVTPNDNSFQSDDCEGAINDYTHGMGACVGCGYQQAQSRGKHIGGVVVGMCDGSVRFVKNSVSQQVWWFMNARDDGNTWTDN